MKTRKLRKFLMLLASALLLVSVTVGATVAYLTAEDSVKNTFTVGKVGLTLDELDVDKDENEKDNVLAEDGTTRDEANAYHLLPGKNYVKDPTVHIAADSEDGILFVKVTNGIKDIEDATTIHDQMLAKGWEVQDAEKGIYRYNCVVTKEEDIVVFSEFTIKGNVTETQLDAYKNKTVEVSAYLIQSAGFVNEDGSIKYDEAWAALNK